MLTLLVFITLSGQSYQLVDSCTTFSTVSMPMNDHQADRILYMCFDLLNDKQQAEIAEHELLHMCIHDHVHEYTSMEDMQKHLDSPYKEESLIETVAPCIIDNRANFEKAIGRARVYFLKHKQSSHRRSHRWPFKHPTS